MAAPNIPKKYKAAVYDKPGTISTKIEELDMPEPGPGEVLVNLSHSGVCHSDMGIMTQSWKHLPFPTQPGQVGGHEGVGKIVKMGPATDLSMVKVGDRVGIKWMSGICETCEPCRLGLDASCVKGVSDAVFDVCWTKELRKSCRESQATTRLVRSSSTCLRQRTMLHRFQTISILRRQLRCFALA